MTETPPGKHPLFIPQEWRAITLALAASTLTLFTVAVIDVQDPHLGATLMSSIGLHAVGARAPAILVCLARGMSGPWSLFFNFYIEVIITVLSFYTFVLIVREGVEYRILHLAAQQAEAAAQTRKSWVKRYELVGMFFLVMAPLPLTGPVTGAILGYLLNLPPWRIFTVVLSGSLAMQAIYVLMGKALLNSVIAFQKAHQAEALALLGLVIALVTVTHIRGVVKLVRDMIDGQEPPS